MKFTLRPLVALAFLSPLHLQAQDTVLHTPHLAGMDNFRDIAGLTTPYSTTHNGVMRAGVFYRSNALAATSSDLAILEDLRVTTVVDLRSPAEIAAQADTLPANSHYVAFDLITNSGAFVLDVNHMNADGVDAVMSAGERSFVTSAYSRQQLGNVFRALATADDAALFHCSAGKDRAGWVSAVLQSIAGVSAEDVMANYLATNDYTAARLSAILATLPPAQRETYAALMSVRANWLQAGLDQVVASYGSMDNYLKEGLGLDQQTIYVLRGKMVRYLALPGESAFRGNAAKGAAFLRALQDSPLSGRDTAFNRYLQSAVDQGSLGGVEQRIGGQVFADASSYLLRQPSRLYDAIAPATAAQGLAPEQSQFWLQGLSGYLGTNGSAQAGEVGEHTDGAMVGVTHRFTERSATHGAIGYSRGSVSSAGGEVKTRTTQLEAGGRYGLVSLADGPWVGVQGSMGYIDYQSTRTPGPGFGTADGSAHGQYYSSRASFGWLSNASTLTFEPAVGLQATHLNINGWRETGSETALNVRGINKTQLSLIADTNIRIQPQQAGRWLLTPGITLGYERILNDKTITHHATLYGFTVDQSSAFGSGNLYKTGLQLNAKYQHVTLDTHLDYITTNTRSHGLSGGVNIAVQF